MQVKEISKVNILQRCTQWKSQNIVVINHDACMHSYVVGLGLGSFAILGLDIIV